MQKFKILVSASIIFTMLLSSTIIATAGTIPKVYINGNKVMMQSSPVNENGTIYVPLKQLCDTMGVSLKWDNGVITLQEGNNTVITSVGSNSATVNGEKVSLNLPIKLVDGKAYAPADFVNAVLNTEIEINKADNILNISYEFPTDKGQKFDIFGRLIRTTDLPGNAWEYPYIAAGVPNYMYEKDLTYNVGKWFVEPIENKDFIRPVNMAKFSDVYTDDNIKMWIDLVSRNLDLRLNVSYKDVTDDWTDALIQTYYTDFRRLAWIQGLGREDYTNYELYYRDVQEYIEEIKFQQLTIEGDYYIEPSMIYRESGTRIRVWVKFILKSVKVEEARTYSSRTEPYVKTNTWYEGYVDLIMGSQVMLRDAPGSNYKLRDDMFSYEISYVQENQK